MSISLLLLHHQTRGRGGTRWWTLSPKTFQARQHSVEPCPSIAGVTHGRTAEAPHHDNALRPKSQMVVCPRDLMMPFVDRIRRQVRLPSSSRSPQVHWQACYRKTRQGTSAGRFCQQSTFSHRSARLMTAIPAERHYGGCPRPFRQFGPARIAANLDFAFFFGSPIFPARRPHSREDRGG